MKRVLRRYWLELSVAGAFLAIVGLTFVTIHSYSDPEQPVYQTKNYSQIEEGLYVGGQIGEPPPGVRAVLNLCERKDPYEAEVHRWVPIPDAPPAPSLDWLRQQVEFITEQRRAGRPIFVHCAAGVSRSVMVTAAYLMEREGWSRDRALDYIRASRKNIGPNSAFMARLLEWEKVVSKPRGGSEP